MMYFSYMLLVVVRLCAILFLNEWFDGYLYNAIWLSDYKLYRWFTTNTTKCTHTMKTTQTDDDATTFLCQYTKSYSRIFLGGRYLCLKAMIVFVESKSASRRSAIYLLLLCNRVDHSLYGISKMRCEFVYIYLFLKSKLLRKQQTIFKYLFWTKFFVNKLISTRY